jgi:anti-anti-sigma factor
MSSSPSPAVAPGDHCCLLHESDAERRAALADFVRAGTEAGAKVLELPDPAFDPDATVTLLRRETEVALAEGFSGLCVLADMSSAPGGDPGCERVLVYERAIDALFDELPLRALCQYDKRRFSERSLWGTAHAHRRVVSESETGYRAAGMLELALAEDGTVRLRGEADATAAGALEDALSLTCGPRRFVRVETAELGFVDASGLRAIESAATRLRDQGGHMTLVSPTPTVRKMVELMGIRGASVEQELA